MPAGGHVEGARVPSTKACPITCGLDALISWDKGVMSRLDATPKPPKVKCGTPSTLRVTTPLTKWFWPLFFRLRLKISEITTRNGGGHAQSRIILVPRIMLLSLDGVRGDAPQINRYSGE